MLFSMIYFPFLIFTSTMISYLPKFKNSIISKYLSNFSCVCTVCMIICFVFGTIIYWITCPTWINEGECYEGEISSLLHSTSRFSFIFVWLFWFQVLFLCFLCLACTVNEKEKNENEV